MKLQWNMDRDMKVLDSKRIIYSLHNSLNRKLSSKHVLVPSAVIGTRVVLGSLYMYRADLQSLDHVPDKAPSIQNYITTILFHIIELSHLNKLLDHDVLPASTD